MYGLFTYNYHKNQLTVGKWYTIHGSYGIRYKSDWFHGKNRRNHSTFKARAISVRRLSEIFEGEKKRHTEIERQMGNQRKKI